jgi:transcriptional regulator with XRE-family HTH domain
MHTSILTGLGPALRWLRDRRGRKQYEVANAAGITKGMLSAYETGRQRPSLDTLDKVLETLGCDLNDLHNALRIVNGEPAGLIRTERRGSWPGLGGGFRPGLGGSESRGSRAGAEGEVDVYETLGITERLPEQEERALSEMLQGFHRLLRFFHLGPTDGSRPAGGESGPAEGAEGDESGAEDGESETAAEE